MVAVVTDQIEWLRTQIQDRKAKAEAAREYGIGQWAANVGDDEVEVLVALREDLPEPPDVMGGYWGVVAGWGGDDLFMERLRVDDVRPFADHIAANDPRDTIARCDSDLAILDMAEREIAAAPERSWDWDSADEVSRAGALEDVVRLLAQGYRHRPGYPWGETP